jgi:hypothetical protein
MKKFSISSGTLKRIKERASKLPLLNNSIRKGEGSLVAYIGEEVVKKVLDGDIKDTYDYDIIYNGTKVDVKTKERTVPPKLYYECSVADFNTRQDCDEYAFVSVLNNMKEAWYLGKVSKSDFYKTAVFHKKGEVDPANNFTFKADCYNIPVWKLLCS